MIENLRKLSADKPLLLILLIGLLLRTLLALKPDLGMWDERFHALVAKNLTNDPLHPRLITDGVLALNFREWWLCDTWLAKPPLTLWMMALSMKIFGFNIVGLRAFTVLLAIGTLYLAYRIALMVFQRKVALFATFFMAVNGYLLEVNSGFRSGDHVETFFLFFFHLAMFFLARARNDLKTADMVKVGITGGLTFLCKWNMSFFVIAICGYLVVLNSGWKNSLKLIFVMVTAYAASCLPWLIYIFYKYPEIAAWQVKGLFLPVSEAIHGHTGQWWYYLDALRIMISEVIYIPMIWLLICLFRHSATCVKPAQNHFLAVWIFIPLIILSVCSTKREVYIMICALPLYMLLSVFITMLHERFADRKTLVWVFTVLVIIAAVRYCVERIKPLSLNFEKPEYRVKMEQFLYSDKLGRDSSILIYEPRYLECRFFYSIKAYDYLPDSLVNIFRQAGYKIIVNDEGIYKRKD